MHSSPIQSKSVDSSTGIGWLFMGTFRIWTIIIHQTRKTSNNRRLWCRLDCGKFLWSSSSSSYSQCPLVSIPLAATIAHDVHQTLSGEALSVDTIKFPALNALFGDVRSPQSKQQQHQLELSLSVSRDVHQTLSGEALRWEMNHRRWDASPLSLLPCGSGEEYYHSLS